MRSAPAMTANSAAATAVLRSLCGCTLSTMLSRRARFLCIHSIWSAYRLGVVASMVAGRFSTILQSGVGCQTSATALDTSSANSGSVVLKTSGEYW